MHPFISYILDYRGSVSSIFFKIHLCSGAAVFLGLVCGRCVFVLLEELDRLYECNLVMII